MISNKIFNPAVIEALELFAKDGLISLNPTLEKLFNELMKVERAQVVGAESYERSEDRRGYCNGFKNKTLLTRSGKLNLKVPQTRDVSFYPSCLQKGERAEQALKVAIAEMYFTGVSTRRVKQITEELCGTEVSSSQVSRLAALLDNDFEKFRGRPLGEFIYVFLDAHYENVRHEGQVRDLAVLKAVGVNKEGKREVLGVSCSLSEAEIHWRTFIESLLARGMKGIKLIISDDHAGLKAALRATLPSVPWQRCIFHLSQNAQHYAPNVVMKGEIAQAVKDIYQALDRKEAEQRLCEAVAKYQSKAKKFCDWLEENFNEGLAFYNYPRSHWKKIRTVNLVEKLNQEIRRRTSVARLFPNEASCERLVTAVLMDKHEEWVTGKRYIIIEK